MLAGLIAACALAADPDLTVTPLGPARAGGVLRVLVRTSGDPVVAPAIVVELRDGGTSLASANAALPAGGGEAVLVLTPGSVGSGDLRLRATVTWTTGGRQPRILQAESAVATPQSALRTLAGLVERLRASGRDDPLPWLWAEQAGELTNGGTSAASIGEITLLAGRLAAWLADPQDPRPAPGTLELAVRDPVDGSVQPYRLHLPPGRDPHPVIVLLPAAAPALGKAHWPASDPRLVDAALTAGIAVVACYPAGDRAWNGAARRRVPLALAAAARLAPLDLDHGACVAPASGIAGEGLPYAMQRMPASMDAAWCRSLLGPRLPAVSGSAWSDAPFAVVVGGSENLAAVTANRAIAVAFRAAYAAHAHAVVDLLDDGVDPARLAGRNLVLIGNPLSNRVLAGLHLDLPWRWDHRAVTGADGTHRLRNGMPPLVCRTRLPDGRSVIILDGAVPTWGEGLPLAP